MSLAEYARPCPLCPDDAPICRYTDRGLWRHIRREHPGHTYEEADDMLMEVELARADREGRVV